MCACGKVLHAQNAGAVAAIIANHDMWLERMEHWDSLYRPFFVKTSFETNIPAVMVTSHAGAKIRRAVEDSSQAALQMRRVTVSASKSMAMAWSRLEPFRRADTWPADAQARDKLFEEMEHANQGSVERMMFLALARKNANAWWDHREKMRLSSAEDAASE